MSALLAVALIPWWLTTVAVWAVCCAAMWPWLVTGGAEDEWNTR